MKSTFAGCLHLAPAIALSFFAPPLPAQPAGYYDAADASSPAALRHSLHEIIDDHQRFPYTSDATDTWDVLELADELPGDAGRIITLYRNAAFDKRGGGNDFYNREHVWPNSYGFPDNDASVNYPFTDMHALFLEDIDYNSARSNHPFNYCDASCFEWVTEANDGRGGDVFDSAAPAVGPPVQDGTMQVRFSGCNAGVVSYDLPSVGLAGDVPIERIVLDNVALCESLGQ